MSSDRFYLTRMAAYTAAEKEQIVALADAGETWEAIGLALGRSATAVEHAAHRMRKRGEWPANSDAVRLPPDGPGRPRNRKRSTAVSVRVSPAVEAALRDVAQAAGLGSKLGRVLSEAVRRAATRARKRRPGKLPFAEVQGRELVNAAKTSTLSVCVDAEAFAQLTAASPDTAPMTVLYDAVERLLVDLGYVFVDAEES